MRNILIVLCAFFAISISGCLTMTCENRVVIEIENPEKTYKLVKFDRDCGATTSGSTQISIIKKTGSLPDMGGNIFIANRDTVEMKWLSNSEVLIRYRDQLDTFLRKTAFEGFTIKYENLIIPQKPILTRKKAFDSKKIDTIEIAGGKWKWKDQEWDLNSDQKIVISDHRDIEKICTAVKSAEIATGTDICVDHSLNISIYPGDVSLMLVDVEKKFYFFYETVWYRSDSLAAILSYHLKKETKLH